MSSLSSRRGSKEPEPDPDALAKTSDPAWAAEVERKRQEHLRQGQLLATSWVSAEKQLRPFASDERLGTPGESAGRDCGEARRAQAANATGTFLMAFEGARPANLGTRPGLNKVGVDVSMTDIYEGAVYDDGSLSMVSAGCTLSGTVFGAAPAVPTSSQTTSRQGGGPAPSPTRRPQSAPAHSLLASAASLGSSPRWSLLRSTSDIDAQQDQTVGETDADAEEEPEELEVPAGNGLIFWSEEDLRNFAAKRDVKFEGDRANLEEVVTAVLRSDLEKCLKDAHKKPIGMDMKSPLPTFTFATDAKLTAAMGQARAPRHLSTATQAVLGMLRQAMSHNRTVFGLEMSDLKAAFAAMDTDDSGSLSAEELQEAFQQLDMTLTDEACGVLFELLDTDHTGVVNYTELLRAMKSGGGGVSASSEKPVTLNLKQIDIGSFSSVRGPSGICAASLTIGSATAPGGRIGGASLTWVVSRNDAYRNRGRVVLPLSDVIGLDVDGATLTVEVGRPPMISVGHSSVGHSPMVSAGATTASETTVNWEAMAKSATADKLTRGEAHRSRFHTLRANSAFELNEWKQVLMAASYDHQTMLDAGIPHAERKQSALRTDDGRFNSIHRHEFDVMHGSTNAARAHDTDGRSIVMRKRPASASAVSSSSRSSMARGGSMPGCHQSGSADDLGSISMANVSTNSRDRRGRLRHRTIAPHRSVRSSVSLGGSGWSAAHGSQGRSHAFARTAQDSRQEEVAGQWEAAAGKQSLLGHRPRVGAQQTVRGEDGYGYSGAVATHHSRDAVGGIVVVRSAASRQTAKMEENSRSRNARRSHVITRDHSSVSLGGGGSSASLTSRSMRSPSLYADKELISKSLLRRLRVQHSVVAC